MRPPPLSRVLRARWVAAAGLLCLIIGGVVGQADSARSVAAHGLTETQANRPLPGWPDDGAVDHPIASAGCGQAQRVTPGSSAHEVFAVNPATNNGATTREYLLHVPTGYTATRPTPVVLIFHGGGGTAAGAEAGTGFSQLADQHGFLAVYPQGLAFGALGAGYTTWAATGPLDTFSGGTDELLFVSNLLDDVQARYCVDPQCIYATGFSAGGAMTAFLTCGLTGRIAAFAPMSGDAYQFNGGCFPHHPTSILEFHGAADPFELYAGVPAREDPDWRRTGVMEWLTTWVWRDGCPTGPSIFLNQPPAMGEQWAGCRNGFAIAHYRIENLGHSWPPPIAGLSAQEIMWRFFEAHPLQLS